MEKGKFKLRIRIILLILCTGLPKEEFEQATKEEVAKSTLGNSVIQWLVDNWCSNRLTPSQKFTEFISNNVRVDVTLPSLPSEIIRMIFDKTREHITMLAITGVNKEFRLIYDSRDQWRALVSFIWGSQAVHYGTNVSTAKGKWRDVFRELYEESSRGPVLYCNHCHEIHSAFSEQPEIEYEWDHCPCPDCDAGSWMKCGYRDEYLY
jgi:hypothetical protein